MCIVSETLSSLADDTKLSHADYRTSQRTLLCRRTYACVHARLPHYESASWLPVPERGRARSAVEGANVVYFPPEGQSSNVQDACPGSKAIQGTTILKANTIFVCADLAQALEALKEGIIDGVGGVEETLAMISELKLTNKSDKGVYGSLKKEMWRETVFFLDNWEEQVDRVDELTSKKEAQAKERRLKAFNARKAKL